MKELRNLRRPLNDLFREVYGDYELAYEWDERIPSSKATARIYVQDSVYDVGRIEVEMPIVPGYLPSTETGGTVPSPWRCG